MDGLKTGNWDLVPWRVIRQGIEQAVIALDARESTLTIGRVHNGAEIRPHTHMNEQLAMVLEGCCDYYAGGRPHKLVPGSWLVIPPDVEHYIHVYESETPCLVLELFTPRRDNYCTEYLNFLSEQGLRPAGEATGETA